MLSERTLRPGLSSLSPVASRLGAVLLGGYGQPVTMDGLPAPTTRERDRATGRPGHRARGRASGLHEQLHDRAVFESELCHQGIPLVDPGLVDLLTDCLGKLGFEGGRPQHVEAGKRESQALAGFLADAGDSVSVGAPVDGGAVAQVYDGLGYDRHAVDDEGGDREVADDPAGHE